MVRWLPVLLAVALALPVRAQPAARPASGEAVALLPLDADHQLAIYGQPVASAIAHALVKGGVDVVVVGPHMAVPARARLIVDGTIAAKGQAVVLSVRVRDRRDGTVLETLEATAPKLTSIDKAAADVSSRVLPSVSAQLAKLRAADRADRAEPPPPAPPLPAAPPAAAMLESVITSVNAAPSAEPLRAPLTAAVEGWIDAHHRAPAQVDSAALGVKRAAGTLAERDAASGILFEILAYEVEPGTIPMARAWVHVRVVRRADAGEHAVAFDRVIVTDTIVGDRGLPPGELAARAAREVLAIAEPHVRRALASWR